MLESLGQLRKLPDFGGAAVGDKEVYTSEVMVFVTRRDLDELADAIEREVEERYVELPKDADGEYIHIGDEMEGVDKYDSLKKVMGKVITVSFESDGTTDVAIQAWSSDGKSWHRAYLDSYASVYRHHHAPTVEDVLKEFASERIKLFLMMPMSMSDEGIREFQEENREACEKLTAEYAAKLQFKEDR